METYRCQFCEKSSPVAEWKSEGYECPKCGQMYDCMLAQDSEE